MFAFRAAGDGGAVDAALTSTIFLVLDLARAAAPKINKAISVRLNLAGVLAWRIIFECIARSFH